MEAVEYSKLKVIKNTLKSEIGVLEAPAVNKLPGIYCHRQKPVRLAKTQCRQMMVTEKSTQNAPARAPGALVTDNARASKGRKAGGIGNSSHIEDVACVLAASDACEAHASSTDANREAAAAKVYSAWMIYCKDTLHIPWTDRVVGTGASRKLVTFEIVCAERPLLGGIIKKFKGDFLKHANNVIMPGFAKFLTQDGDMPSGKNQDDHELFLKNYLWHYFAEEKALNKAKLIASKGLAGDEEVDVELEDNEENSTEASEEPAGEEEADEGSPAPPPASAPAQGAATNCAEAPKKGASPKVAAQPMPLGWDGGKWFLAWKILGPWGKKHKAIAVSTANTLPKRGCNDGRAAQKRKEEDVAAKVWLAKLP